MVTLGIGWNCRSQMGQGTLQDPGICYRKVQDKIGIGGVFVQPNHLGIYPTINIPDPLVSSSFRWPLLKLLGERENDASRQIWGRTLARMLGLSTGLSKSDAKNDVTPLGRTQQAHNVPLTPVPVENYVSYANLSLKPSSVALQVKDDPWRYALLAAQDPDVDGQLEGADVCPGQYDNGEEQFTYWTFYYESAGNACNSDLDGDNQINATPLPAFVGPRAPAATNRAAAVSAAPVYDQRPYDTDNDGLDNPVDPDDDNHGVLDTSDNCRWTVNTDQKNLDGDVDGDVCDGDADGDGIDRYVEAYAGSDDLSALKKVEFLGEGSTCSNGVDDDGDGLTDAADPFCQDPDGDTIPTVQDNCPTISNEDQEDRNGNEIGRDCDLEIETWSVRQTVIDAVDLFEVQWIANTEFVYRIRAGGNCTGSVIETGIYEAGTPEDPGLNQLLVPKSQLAAYGNAVTICGNHNGVERANTITFPTPLTSTDTPTIALARDADGGVLGDNVTSGEQILLTGTASPGTNVTVTSGGTSLGTTTTDLAGNWELWVNATPGTGSYIARAADRYGNSATSIPVNVSTDSTAPDTSSAITPTADGAVLTFASTKPNSTFECSLDDKPFRPCTSPLTINGQANASTHTFRVRAVDTAGNFDQTPSAQSYTVNQSSVCSVCALGEGNNILNGSAKIQTTDSSISFNSTTPLVVNGGASITASGTGTRVTTGAASVLRNGQPIVTPNPTLNTSIPDPLANLATPTPVTSPDRGSFILNTANSAPPALQGGSWNSITVNGANSTVTLNPGTYGNVTVQGAGTKLNLLPGVYTFTGALALNGNAAMSGTDVLLYFTCGTHRAPRACTSETGGKALFNGQNSLTGLAGRSITDATHPGVLVFIDRQNDAPLIFNGGTANPVSSGTIYAPGTPVTFNGNVAMALPSFSRLVMKTLVLNGSARLTVNG